MTRPLHNFLDPEVLDFMFHHDMRIAKVMHVQGAIVCGGESLPDEMQEFLDDQTDLLREQAEKWKPGEGAQWVDNALEAYERERKEDRRGAQEMFTESMVDLLRILCPNTFIVAIDWAMAKCVMADPEREDLGTWQQGFGYYRTSYFFVDSIPEAVSQCITLVKERRRAQWRLAIDAGKVHKPRKEAAAEVEAI